MTNPAVQLAQISQWVNAGYDLPSGPPGGVLAPLLAELVLRRRVEKVGNEYGEVLDALEGVTGENRRKGYFATSDDLIYELLDLATAALAVVEHVSEHRGSSLLMLDHHIDDVHIRAGLQSGVSWHHRLIVLRHAADLARESWGFTEVYEGQWYYLDEIPPAILEPLGHNMSLRAFPTKRHELRGDCRMAQVYEIRKIEEHQ